MLSLERRPISTQVISGTLFGALGDYICQTQVERNSDVQGFRIFSFGTYSSFEVYLEWIWTRALDVYFGKSMNFLPTLRKTIVDNFVFQPFELELLFAWIQLLERPKETLWEKSRRDFLPSLGYSFVFWFPISFGIFYYCPLKFRVMASDSICILWDVFLSFVGHNDIMQHLENLFSKNTKQEE